MGATAISSQTATNVANNLIETMMSSSNTCNASST